MTLAADTSSVSVNNSILWGNLDDLRDDSGNVVVTYSDIGEGNVPGAGNISVNPLFMASADRDYRLNPWSPCIDAGTNAVSGLPTIDILGAPRISDGNGDSLAVVDMGAYESQVSIDYPVVSGLMPSSGTVGSTFTVNGDGFGGYSQVSSRVYVGTIAATVVSWSTTTINAVVPYTLLPGTNPVSLELESYGRTLTAIGGDYVILPEISVSEDGLVRVISPNVELTVSAVSTSTVVSSSPVYVAMSDANLEPAMPALYEVEPSGLQFAVPVVLMFSFDPVAVDTATLAIYYFDGVSWSSSSVLNQRVVFESTDTAYLEGEVLHTSMYALLRERSVLGPTAKVSFEPSTLNKGSNGQYVTAELSFLSGTGCFALDSVNINAVNGHALREPIYAELPGRGHGKRASYDVQCGTATVKFDREKVAAALTENSVSVVEVSGLLADATPFAAQDTIRTVGRFKGQHAQKWKFSHACGASIEGRKGSLKEDLEMYMLRVDGDLGGREKLKDRSAASVGGKRRGAAFEFGPEGLVFDEPVTISLPYEAAEKNPERLAVAYWNEAASAWERLASRVDRSGRYIKADVPHFSQYQLLESTFAVSITELTVRVRDEETDGALPASAREFRLGEVYVFPNPAKGGKVPVFHVEVGVADTVKIRVYTVAGQLVHEASVGGEPQVVGSAYAYEYAWQGRIASGVYFYTIEARRGGAKLKARGKLAVIR